MNPEPTRAHADQLFRFIARYWPEAHRPSLQRLLRILARMDEERRHDNVTKEEFEAVVDQWNLQRDDGYSLPRRLQTALLLLETPDDGREHLPSIVYVALAGLRWQPHALARIDLSDEACPMNDPDCYAPDGGSHDACERPAYVLTQIERDVACPCPDAD
jgi:hypothetical protein